MFLRTGRSSQALRGGSLSGQFMLGLYIYIYMHIYIYIEDILGVV